MAAETEWFRAFVERSLQKMWEMSEVAQDNDGDYPFGEDQVTGCRT